MATVSVDTTVDVDVELTDFEFSDIIDYLHSHGYTVYEDDESEEYYEEVSLTKDECEILLSKIDEPKVGSDMWFLLDKIRTWYNAR